MSELCNQGDSSGDAFSHFSGKELVAGMRCGFDSGGLEERKEALGAILRLLEEREDELLDALAADLGKPRMEAWLAEVLFVKQELKYTLKYISRWVRPRRVGNPFYFLPARSEIRREPFGVVLVMAPWNYPFQLALSPAISAIAAGNSVVIKPSEAAPATAAVLERLIRDVARPGRVTVVCGDAKVGAELLKQDFDFFFFTGGERVGRLVAEAAARRMVPCVLELGGKSPAVIDSSVDVMIAVERIVLGKFFNGGQTCMAPDFMLVPEGILDEVKSCIEKVLGETYRLEGAEMASCVHREQYARVLSLVPDGAHRIGDDEPDELRLAPRWAVVDWDDASMKEEVFGPFLPILTYSSDEECVGRLACFSSPLALYVFSVRERFIDLLTNGIRSGSVCINDVIKQATNLELPFGGVGSSGYGRYRGKAGFDAFTYERSVTKRFMIRDLFQVKPPYGEKLKTMRRWVK